ncbi:histidine--tRNA ligase [Haliscomenobacter hydrossis]|uniref:Histidine--tRNA ligase n=1 Tax=Haliscomenobacter hydrossis (strain ATCC 27775 / DSM 1100 / LMG 10767 / O) TaxID=760192 RepID=F4KPG7_HALH1|nr:histidine--tRNA ligase [Haliscomenobacter hydrossis]AEE49921.1 Histidyl-tRNA synthetase [Haliscomenobacter hydrossis DSM 1100]
MKPSTAEGTRDFTPDQVLKRNYIFDTIRSVFVKFGYLPIETPAMENLSTLSGKYGEEGDRLLFKILNNGEYLKGISPDDISSKAYKTVTPALAKRGLRYDLTVPFARFVVMHQNELTFPFKRYQIQPVWRADRPQKGRYREFYQCDVDVVGSTSLVYEAELVQIYDEVFSKLNLPVVIKFNNRKILEGIAEVAGIPERMVEMTVAIDKLDKIGLDGIKKEMGERGIDDAAIATITQILSIQSLDELQSALESSERGKLGIQEVQALLQYLGTGQTQQDIRFDITLARGLNYYTGCIFEVQAKGVAMGSIGGGGRYDNLTGVFGLKDVSGVGVSFGAERIYDVLEELKLFPADTSNSLKVLFMAFDEAAHLYAFAALGKLRAAGVNSEIYPDPGKIKKQMKYANDRQVPFVVLVGEEEMSSGLLSFKNMQSGEQEKLTIEEIIVKTQAQ